MQNLNNLKRLSIPSILLAVAVLASGCHKTEKTTVETNGMGPGQTAGKAVDDAGANTAAAARQAGDNMSDAAVRTGAAAREAGAEAKADAHEAGQDIKQGAKDATDATGKAVERTGQKMQDAAK
jgi:uncharacterized protein YceK